MKNLQFLLSTFLLLIFFQACETNKSATKMPNENQLKMIKREVQSVGIYLENYYDDKKDSDYTNALRSAIEESDESQLPILLVPNKEYLITETIDISGKSFEIRNNGIIKGKYNDRSKLKPKKNSDTYSCTGENLFSIRNLQKTNIKLSEVQFLDFGYGKILDLKDYDVEYSIVADRIAVENCATFVSSFTQKMDRIITNKGCLKFVLTNSTFKDITNGVVRLKQRYVKNVRVESNLIDGVSMYYGSRVSIVEIGNGNYNTESYDIIMSSNVLKNCKWIGNKSLVPIENCNTNTICAGKIPVSYNQGQGGAGLMAVGCKQVNITNNIFWNLYSIHKCDESARKVASIYVKSVDCIIANNNMVDAGDGEGSIITKGWTNSDSAGVTGAAHSYNNIIVNNHISFNDSYRDRITSSLSGILVCNKNIIISNNQIIGISRGIEVRGQVEKVSSKEFNEVGNINIFNNQFIDIESVGLCSARVTGVVFSNYSNRVNIKNNIFQFKQDDSKKGSIKAEGIVFNILPYEGIDYQFTGVVIDGNTFRYLHRNTNISSKGIVFNLNKTDANNISIMNNIFEDVKQCVFFGNAKKDDVITYDNIFIAGNNVSDVTQRLAKQKNGNDTKNVVNIKDIQIEGNWNNQAWIDDLTN
jgi:hypothetical protein